MTTYESRLASDTHFALEEGGRHMGERGAVNVTLRKVCRRLDELSIPYVLVGGMAMFIHGFRRFTEDVDLLLTRDGLSRAMEALEGLGYLRPAGTGRQLRDTDTGVRVEFLVAGDYPGDGKPKPVAFPDPLACAVELDNLRVISLPALVEIKLASGMTAPHRLKDLADVQELIRVLRLDREFAGQLHEYVRARFIELWNDLQATPQ